MPPAAALPRTLARAAPPALALVVLAAGIAVLLSGVDPPDAETLGKLGPAVPLFAFLQGLPWGVWGSLALLLLALRVGLTVVRGDEEPLPAYLLLATFAVVLAAYNWSNLDWLSLPLETEVADGGVPAWTDVVVPLVLLAAAILYSIAVQWNKAERDYAARGVDPAEAAEARRVLPVALPVLGGAAVLTLAVASLFHWASTEKLADKLPVVPSVLLFPLLAIGVLVGLAYLAARRPGLRKGQAGRSGGTANGP